MITFCWDRKEKRAGKSRARSERGRRLTNAVIVCCFLLGMFWECYVCTYYRGDAEAQEAMQSGEGVTVSEIKNGWFFDGPGEEKALIFYPGAKVESEAYAPLLYQLAAEGMDCFLMEMPWHLAIFGGRRADAVRKEYSYDSWYLAGHSLGGAIAAIHASFHMEYLDGLVLLAAYPSTSLADEDFEVLTIYGSNDQVLKQQKLETGMKYMPERFTELCIQGGNHAQFGSYGVQAGDGEAVISPQEQRRQTIEAILTFAEMR